jgi:4-hydroxyphenylpyruvate dioxygenase
MESYMRSVHEGSWIQPSTYRDVEAGKDPLAIEGIDYAEFYVENARQAAHYFCTAFGFTPIAYRGPETKYPDAASYVLKQNKITFVITAPLRSTSIICHQVAMHGMTVHDIAFRVPNCEAFYAETMKRGATSAESPQEWGDDNGTVRRAAIKAYGDTIHSIVERSNYKGDFWPGFVPYESLFAKPEGASLSGLMVIDHMVANVELGKMDAWVKYYEDILGFAQFQSFSDEQITTEYSALMSKVMSGGKGKIKLPINEPATGKRKSQIQEYLEFHNGPGVQHLALATNNIIEVIKELRKRGVTFLSVPQTYYDELPARVGKIKQDLQELAKLGILVDRDEDGYLLQLFTKPLHDRPTIFFEIIQREGSSGFGVGNFKALFEAIERDQELRGNL